MFCICLRTNSADDNPCQREVVKSNLSADGRSCYCTFADIGKVVIEGYKVKAQVLNILAKTDNPSIVARARLFPPVPVELAQEPAT